DAEGANGGGIVLAAETALGGGAVFCEEKTAPDSWRSCISCASVFAGGAPPVPLTCALAKGTSGSVLTVNGSRSVGTSGGNSFSRAGGGGGGSILPKLGSTVSP